jgi:hypothetical protein
LNKQELIAFIKSADENTKGVFLIKSTSDKQVLHMCDGYYTIGESINQETEKSDGLMFLSDYIDMGINYTLEEFEAGKVTIEYFPEEV